MFKSNKLIRKRTAFLVLKPLHLLFHLHYWSVLATHDPGGKSLVDRSTFAQTFTSDHELWARTERRREFPSDAGHQPLNPQRQAQKLRHPRGSSWTSPWGESSGMSCWEEISRWAQDTLGVLHPLSSPGTPCCSPRGTGRGWMDGWKEY